MGGESDGRDLGGEVVSHRVEVTGRKVFLSMPMPRTKNVLFLSPGKLQQFQSSDESDVRFVMFCDLKVQVHVGSLETKPCQRTSIQSH